MKPSIDLTAPLKALLIASIVLPVLLFTAVARESYVNAFREAEARAQHVSYMVEEHALKTLEAIALALKLADQRLKGVSWDEIRMSHPLWAEVAEVQRALQQADSIFVLDRKGDVVLTTREFPSPAVDFSDRDYYRAQTDADAGIYISAAYLGKISKWPIFNLSIRRSSASGEFDGVVGSSASIEYFTHFYETIAENPGVALSLVRDGGEVLVQYPQTSLATPTMEKNGSQGFHDDGAGRFVVSRQVGAFPVHIEYAIDKSVVFAAWYRRLAGWATLTLVIAGALFATSSVALRRAVAERSAREELERQIRYRERAEAQLRQAQKMEALGRLTGGVAHDFNNLIQIIIGGVYRLRRIADPKVQKTVDLIDQSAQRSAHLTRQLLSFSRRQKLNPMPTDLRSKLQEIAPLLERSLRRDIAMALDVTDATWPVEVDSVELEIALINIAANARDAMPAGGRLEIIGRNVTLDGSETTERLAGDFVELAVTDTGSGMSHDVMERAFEPFFTTKEQDRGTGLGLSQVYGFARESGGTVTLSSGDGSGTCVKIYLPRAIRSPIAVDARRDVAEVQPGTRRILMVEDNAEVAATGADMLRDLGYLVDVVNSGQRALWALAGKPGRHALVFSDIVMPGGMNGLELHDRIRAMYPDLPVVLTSGYSGDVRGDRSDVAVLQKPYEPDVLAATLENALAARCAPPPPKSASSAG